MESSVSFGQLALPEALIASLTKMQFISPTPVQAASIPAALEGRDILATAQTGTGKTGAFAIPMLARLYKNPGQCALVLAPTRELASQIFKVCNDMGKSMNMTGALIVGGESFNRQVAAIKNGPDYIIATPGRLNDHLGEGTLRLRSVTVLVLDEVDRMLDMGFAPQIAQVLKHVPKEKQTMLYSATLPREVMHLVNGLLTDPFRVDVNSVDKPAERITEQTIQTSQEGKIDLLLQELTVQRGKVLIFARTKARTDRLAKALNRSGHNVVFIHGGRTNGQRKDALNKYRIGTHRIMVATDIAGRGIDIDDIEQVINYDVPETREDYIHRIGRTARYGKTGLALNYVTPQDYDANKVLNIAGPRPAAPNSRRPGSAPRSLYMQDEARNASPRYGSRSRSSRSSSDNRRRAGGRSR